MSEYIFGLGVGHLSRRTAKIARAHGATLVNHTDPQCTCGYGCAGDCRSSKRHWFAANNRGEPFNRNLARTVMAAIARARGEA